MKKFLNSSLPNNSIPFSVYATFIIGARSPIFADRLTGEKLSLALCCALNKQNISFSGLYHLMASGETTWYRYSSHLIKKAKTIKPELDWKVVDISPMLASVFPTPVARVYAQKSCRKLLV